MSSRHIDSHCGRARGLIGPLVGMVFVWGYFRHRSFFGVLYPPSAVTVLGDIPTRVYLVFLAFLLIGTVVAIALSDRIGAVLNSRRGLVLVVTAAGSIGSLLAFGAQRGLLSPWIYWLSVILVISGFLLSYLAWAIYCSRMLGGRMIVLLAASYLISLLLFSLLGLSSWTSELIRVIMPIGAGLAWFFTPQPSNTVLVEHEGDMWERRAYSYTGLFIIFLLAGAVVRGIVDEGDSLPGSYLRLSISVIVAISVLLVCWFYWKGRFGRLSRPADQIADDGYAIEHMVLICWVALVLLFFAGVFMGLSSGTYEVGGQIVVVARSTLDFFLWVLLCNLAHHRQGSPIRLFALFGILTEAISWFLSYTVVPHLIATAGAEASEPLVLAIMFFLVASVTVILAVLVLLRKPTEMVSVSASIPAVPCIPSEKVERYGLTVREVEIIQLFSQGHSLKKVAEQMFISVSTAQSHIKSAYRKLGVHSKDELIDLIASWSG